MANTHIYYKQWQPQDDQKAVLVLVHGLAEHCHRYEPLAAYLSKHNIAVSSMDLPGHGRSDGIRGHIDSFEKYQTAVLDLVEKTKLQFPDTPLFLLGHSLGGLISSKFLLEHQSYFQGALLSGAALQTPQEPPAWQQTIIKVIAKLFPKTKILTLDASKVSRDQEVVDAYYADPLVGHEKLSARFLVSMINTMTEVKNNADKINIPLLIMHGTSDVITSPSGSQWLHQAISSKDKTLNMYDGLYHEIFNEPEGPQIFSEMRDWIERHVT